MTNGTSITTTDYIDGFQYEGEGLKFFPHAEGYVNNDDNGFEYVYNYTDHLGNVRLSYKDNNGSVDVVEENNYYPFGLKHNYNLTPSGNQDNAYKYNGKELQDELDLNVYDWGQYDAALGRFNKMDRFSEKYYSKSPYNYVANTPVYYTDIRGDSLWINHKGNKILYQDGKLLNKDGSNYTGVGVKVNKDGSIKLKGFLKNVVNALDNISGGEEGASMIGSLQSSNNSFAIVKGSETKFNFSNGSRAYANQLATDPNLASIYKRLLKDGIDLSGGSGGVILWKSSGTFLITTDGATKSPITDLAHEMFHALDSDNGLLDDRMHNGIEREEWQASYRENILRGQLKLSLRTHYKSSLDASTGVRSGVPPRVLTPAPANEAILPTWYKK